LAGRLSRRRTFGSSVRAIPSWASFERLEKRQVLATDVNVSVGLGITQVDSSIYAGSKSLVKHGEGTLVLSAANTHSGGTVVEQGTLVVRNPAALGSGVVQVRPGAKLVLDGGTSSRFEISSLVLQPGGMINVGTSQLSIQSGFTRTSLVAAINEAEGTDGSWNGQSGIGSSVVKAMVASGTPRTLGWVGWVTNDDLSCIVGFATPGDTNLDGQVDIIDISSMFGNFNNPDITATWSAGDFNHDGRTDALDMGEFVAAGMFDAGSYLPEDPPSAPTNLIATSLSTAAVCLAWQTTGNPRGFEIEQSADGVSGWQAVASGRQTLSRSGAATSVTIGGFSAGQSAFFRVRSYDNSPSWWWDDRYRSADTPTVSVKTLSAEQTTLYWDPDRIPSNNSTITGAGLGGSGVWSDNGEAVWFDPKLNNGAGGYVRWDSTRDVVANFAGQGGPVTIDGAVSASQITFSGSAYVLSGGAFKTAAAGTDFRAMVSAEIKTPIQGTGGINKRGAGTLVVSASVNTYTGETSVANGNLDVRGTIQSHVKLGPSGTISGVMFYDADLARYVRDALGVLGDEWLTPAVLAACPPLTSLTVDGNVIADLTGISNLSSLTSLSFIPADYSVPATGISTLAPLAGLTSLTELRLHDVGLTDAVLVTLPNLSVLKSLDLRYNNVTSVPAAVANLPRLESLFVHGNPRITSDPRTALAALKGKAIDVDVAPDRPDIATDVGDLAGRLYYLPLKMLEYVTNTIAYQPYVGAMKGPLATLQTKAGNDWDTNSLLAALYKAAGVTTRYVEGVATVTDGQLMDYVGTRDPLAARKILAAAGLTNNGVENIFKHTWLEALVNVPAKGVQSWVKIDASWKLRDYRPGLPGVLTQVPFDPQEAAYLTNRLWQKKSTAEYYEAKVAAWLADNKPDLTIADVGYDGPIRQQSFKTLPTDLPYQRASEPLDTAEARPQQIPTTANYKVTIKLANGSVALFENKFSSLADISLSRLTIDPRIVGAGSSQTVQPRLLQDGIGVASYETPIAAPAPSVASKPPMPTFTLTVSVESPAGGLSYYRSFKRAADRFLAIGLDANQFSDSLLVGKRAVVSAQQLSRANGAVAEYDNEKAVGGLLDLAITQYFSAADADEASLALLTSAVPNRTVVGLGIATSAAVLSDATQDTVRLQFPYLPDDMGIDVPGNVFGAFAIDASATDIDPNRDMLLGYTNSSLEGLVLEELTNCESVSTMKAFQLAATNPDGKIDLVKIDRGNVGNIATLLPGVRDEIRSAIARTVTDGLSGLVDYAGVKFTALVPAREITVGGGSDPSKQWKGVGYTLTCDTSDTRNGRTVGYIIHGGVDGVISSSGGAQSRVSTTVVSIPSALSTYNLGLSAGDPVNMATGGVYHEETDFEIPNLGTPIAFRRRYDSIHTVSDLNKPPRPWSDRGMGEGWSFSYSDRIELGVDGANTVTWFTDTGMRLVFTSSANGFTNPAGIFGSLTGSATTGFTWKDFDGNTTMFGVAADGFCPISLTKDRFGNGVAITYVGNTNRIDKVSDLRNAGRWIGFTYNTDARPHIESMRSDRVRTL
jgi:autotransporter-associated beta strand protein